MKKIGIRVDGNEHIGLGHFFRCYHIASFLKEKAIDVHFLMLESSLTDTSMDFLASGGFSYKIVSTAHDPWQEDFIKLKKLIRQNQYDSILVDLIIPDKEDYDLNRNSEFRPINVSEELFKIYEMDIPVFAISDQFDKMVLEPDLIINTCPAQKNQWYQGITKTTYLLGPTYYVLPRSFRKYATAPKIFKRDIPKVVIFCGGNDHRGFTDIILKTLNTSLSDITLEVIIGAATPNGKGIAQSIQDQGVKAHFCLPDLAAVLFDADFVISTSGNTLFDLAALGVPAAALSTRKRQHVTAKFFETNGSCIDLGLEKHKIEQNLSKIVQPIILNRDRLKEMSLNGRKFVDGLGADRLIKEMKKAISIKKGILHESFN